MDTFHKDSTMMLRFDSATVSYGPITVLNDVDLTVEDGFTVLLGPNGAGKSTLFRGAAGVLEPESGSIEVLGSDPHVDPTIKREVGYVPHKPSLNDRLTVHENLEFWGRILSMDTDAITSRISELSRLIGFEDLLQLPARQLSRGQTQRVLLARGLLADPEILLLDEPTTGLDPTATVELHSLLADMADDRKAVVYATHNLHAASSLAENVVLIRDGTIVAEGRPTDLLGTGRRNSVTISVDDPGVEASMLELGYDWEWAGSDLSVALPPEVNVTDLITDLEDHGITVTDVKRNEAVLESIYRELNEVNADGQR